MDLESTIRAIGRLHEQAVTIIAALDQDLRNAPDAARAGALHRLRQVLLDFSHQYKLARDRLVEGRVAMIEKLITRAAT
jgi:hypothetical protein